MIERPRCAWCGEPCSPGAATCAGCADLEREARAVERLPMRADDAERELLALELEQREAGDRA